jgi:hypothetical protein
MSNTIELPVSFGEALDKLSILEIKLEKIKDDRRKDVQVEYDTIKSKLEHLITDDAKYHYSILKAVNLSIWDMQDIFRDSKDEKERIDLCIKIIEDNDRRFRIKSKLNNIFNSHLKEQKGYKKSKALFVGHVGLGDHLTCSSIVRYLATKYDEVKVLCLPNQVNNLSLLYKDDSSIIPHPHIIYDISGNTTYINQDFGLDNSYEKYICGMIVSKTNYYSPSNLPFCFYDDLELPYSIFWDFFHVPTLNESKELYEKVKDISYIFIHNDSSIGTLFKYQLVEKKLNIDHNDTLFINPNKNIYKSDHKFYNLAQEFIGKPLPYYKDTLINASQIIVSDSSFFCLALNIELKTDRCYYIARYDIDYNYLYTEKYGFNSSRKRQVFKPFLEL